MRKSFIAALTIFTLVACNSNRPVRTERIENDNTKTKIEDDGKTLSIKVKTRNTGIPIDYAESFDVANMSNRQKGKLENKILDSLDVKNLNDKKC